ncbi:MAG: sugar ABC transporter permease [Oscillospiraceae bacterium]|nr:sugar ABC transporter permease [Oscillospiraceae bacterium]
MSTLKKYLPRNRIWLFLLPSFIGMLIFFFIPAFVSLYHSLTFGGSFVWLRNFQNTLENFVFRLAVNNTMLFIALSVPLNMIIAFLLAALLEGLKQKKFFLVLFMLPLVIPSGSVVFFWQSLFADNGYINRILLLNGYDTVLWFASDWALPIAILVFIFKNIGFSLVLFVTGYQFIPKEYYEIARIDGASSFQIFRTVTAVYMMPTTFLVFMMSIINSFRIFREIYLLLGRYPNRSVFMLQHFMNNQFAAANMQTLSTTATLLSFAIMLLAIVCYTLQRRLTDSYS